MYDMLIFILFTCTCLLANIIMGEFMMFAIAPEQMFDKMFKWQKMLNYLYGGSTFQQLLGKFLGNCDACFLHFVTILNFFIYAVIMVFGLNNWICKIGFSWQFFLVSAAWYLVYVVIGWKLSKNYNIR